MADKHGYHGNRRPHHWASENEGYRFYNGLNPGASRLDAVSHGEHYSHLSNGNIYDAADKNHYTMSAHNDQGLKRYDSSQAAKQWPSQQHDHFHLRDRNPSRQNSNPNEPRSASNEDSNSDHAENKGCRDIFVRFSKQCSMQGPPYIYNSKMSYAKVLWVVLLLAAMGSMTFHLYYLIKNFTQFSVKNEISLGFSSLEFPAVTVCNVNPVRQSKLAETSANFSGLVNLLSPENIADRIEELTARSEEGSRRKKRQASSASAYDNFIDDLDIGLDNTSFQDPIEDLSDDDYNDFDGYENSWDKEGEDAIWARHGKALTDLYASLDRQTRIDAGHQLDDMLISCSFAGKTCYAGNFTLSTSTTFGNCYTLQYSKLFSRSSGPSGGLELIMYLENDEYIPAVQADSGLQVMIHPQKTLTFPEDEGLAVGGGTHTLISLSLLQVQRKGQPYGNCVENSEFETKYKVLYTRQTCQKFCEQQVIHTRCTCRDETKEDLNINMQAQNSLKPCRSKDEVKCMSKAYWDYSQGTVNCACDNPCSDTKYQKSLSFRTWPHPSFQDLMVTTLCHRESSGVCQKLKDKRSNGTSRQTLADDFVKLNIYYEELNYENITEKPDYAEAQFMSDIGGAVGLWIGLSVLSIFEIFQLGLELLRHFLCCRWRNAVSASRN